MSTLLLLAVLAQANPAGSHQLELVVRDAETARPIPYAIAEFEALGRDASFTLVADSTGRIGAHFAEGDTVVVAFSAIGYESWTFTHVAAGTSSPIDVWLPPRPVELGGLSATVERTDRYLDRSGFYRRAARGIGDFLGPAELERINGTRPSDYLRRMMSVRVGEEEPVFTRGGSGLSTSCFPAVVVDGVLVREANKPYIPFDDLIVATDIEAIETYPSGIGAPPEFSGTGAACGVILIWSKH